MLMINLLLATMLVIMTTFTNVLSQSTLDCSLCHSPVYQKWMQGAHSNTQQDVAAELAAVRTGQTPDAVVNGDDAENCIACHGPIAVTTNGGMTDVEALEHFFTTEGGVFTENTVAADTATWPHVFCTSCHNVPTDHPASMPVFGAFNSTTKQYDAIDRPSSLCGRCHGALRFETTDHLTYNAWKTSKHALTQDDVAGELAEAWAGLPPDSVMHGSEPENCIACHGPTSVLANGGMTETEALDYFFTTQDGTFDESTVSKNADQWPDVSCIACHNPHDPQAHSYFNSATGEYTVFENSADQCGQCHGSLRFEDTDHRSYNIEKGLGAVGVTFEETMPGITCTDCHMLAGEEDTKAAMYHGHTWSIIVTEDDSSQTASCAAPSCHPAFDAAISENVITSFQAATQARLDSAGQMFQAAENALQGSSDETLIAKRDEAESNLFLVQSDESGGFHNRNFQLALLKDVIQKSQEILSATGVEQPGIGRAPHRFELSQNYPNPFNPTTTIEFTLAHSTDVTLRVYTLLGEEVKTIMLDRNLDAGIHKISFSAANLSSGVYVYRIDTPEFDQARKMIVMR